jgi:tRNA-splicing ligase RtcB
MSELQLEKMREATYILPQEEGMNVSGLIIATEELLREVDIQEPLQQVRNVAHLPGIVGYSVAMPDIHWGYGFPIGGVAAMDAEHGVISPGGVGYDINCGVRLAIVPEKWSSFSKDTQEKLISKIFELVPSGVGKGHKNTRGVSDRDYGELLQMGAEWSVKQGFGFERDLMHMESLGKIAGADPNLVSQEAKDRGRDQLGSIGSGNHFVEIGEIDQLFLPEVAKKWGVDAGLTYILIHSGSRGFGHQVCQDTLNHFVKKDYGKGLPDKQLVAAPINSEDGRNYFQAMAAAANYAFNNRQQILHEVRQAFREVCKIKPEDIHLIYDVCHNIAKFEEYEIGGEIRRVCVHRKGATRAFGPGAEELNPVFKETGQPVLVPGDMGRASHLLVGLGNPLTFCSCCHGAGRARSRSQSKKAWAGKDIVEHVRKQGVIVKATSKRTIAEEMPDAYKNVDDVVEAVEQAELAKGVAKLKPHLVLKG